MHKVQIKSEGGKTNVILDGIDISKQCLSYSVSQDGLDWPELSLTLLCDEIDVDAELDKVFAVPAANEKTAPTIADAVP